MSANVTCLKIYFKRLISFTFFIVGLIILEQLTANEYKKLLQYFCETVIFVIKFNSKQKIYYVVFS